MWSVQYHADSDTVRTYEAPGPRVRCALRLTLPQRKMAHFPTGGSNLTTYDKKPILRGNEAAVCWILAATEMENKKKMTRTKRGHQHLPIWLLPPGAYHDEAWEGAGEQSKRDGFLVCTRPHIVVWVWR